MRKISNIVQPNRTFQLVVLASIAVAAILATTLAGRSIGVSGGDEAGGATLQRDTTGPSQLELVLPASSLAQLLRESEIVVLGEFTGVVASTDVVLPESASTASLPRGVSSGIPFSNLAFRVSSYVGGDGPKELLIRQTGDLRSSDGPNEFPKPAANQPTLLFLTRDSHGENVWTSDRGPWGRMRDVDGSMRYQDGEALLVPFFGAQDMDEAIAAVRAANP